MSTFPKDPFAYQKDRSMSSPSVPVTVDESPIVALPPLATLPQPWYRDRTSLMFAVAMNQHSNQTCPRAIPDSHDVSNWQSWLDSSQMHESRHHYRQGWPQRRVWDRHNQVKMRVMHIFPKRQ